MVKHGCLNCHLVVFRNLRTNAAKDLEKKLATASLNIKFTVGKKKKHK